MTPDERDQMIEQIEAARHDDRLSRQRDSKTEPCDAPHWECHASGAWWAYDDALRILRAAPVTA